MIKDIMVHLDGTAMDEFRLDHAERIGATFDAHVTGLYLNVMPEPFLSFDAAATSAAMIDDIKITARLHGDEVADRLISRLDRLTPLTELRRLDIFRGTLPRTVAEQTRWVDLFVAARPYDEDGTERWPTIVETALFESARGLYLVPGRPTDTGSFKRVLIAWNNSRESARALAEAEPFLKRASQVHLVVVDEDAAAEARREEPAADIARHLDRIGVRVELHHISGRSSPSDALLNEIERLGIELAVMGGYGHSRFREIVFGGVTRDFLTRSPIPVIMAH